MANEHYEKYIKPHNERNKMKTHLYKIKSNCKKNGIDFDLTLDDVIVPENCPVLGIPLEHSKGRVSDNSPSIDRINPNGGYTKDNIIVVSWKANRLKSNASVDELIRVAMFYAQIA